MTKPLSTDMSTSPFEDTDVRQFRLSSHDHDGLLGVAAVTPRIRLGDVAYNVQQILSSLKQVASNDAVRVAVFPELCLSGSTCGDLFYDQTLLYACEKALSNILLSTTSLPMLFTVGLPALVDGRVYNAAAVCCRGELLGLSIKEHLSSSEARWFTPAPKQVQLVNYAGKTDVFLGSNISFICNDSDLPLRLGVHIGLDSELSLAQAGAERLGDAPTLVLNPVAVPEYIGSFESRCQDLVSLSKRYALAVIQANAGEGESSTDTVYAGGNIIAQCGEVLLKTERFTSSVECTCIDVEQIVACRLRKNLASVAERSAQSNIDCEFTFAGADCNEEEQSFVLYCSALNPLYAAPAQNPFVSADPAKQAQQCELVLNIQAAALKQRLVSTGVKSVVVGLSGGLDSTLALLVCVRAFDALKWDRSGIYAITMPGLGTTSRTKSNAQQLSELLGTTFKTISITDAVTSHFADINHDPELHDATYENAQARERTQVLMDLANQIGGLVVGTGDLSELALGWATYNGDHMSMYAVNADVPKTLIQHVVEHVANQSSEQIGAVLQDILATPISPELLPASSNDDVEQKTEDLVGPYELHDFFLYYLLSYGFKPAKIYRMACRAFEDVYSPEVIKHWVQIFYRRFFSQQFKRSCSPDGPKVVSVGLSPRGAWVMPSDASARLWLSQVEELV